MFFGRGYFYNSERSFEGEEVRGERWYRGEWERRSGGKRRGRGGEGESRGEGRVEERGE